MQDGKRWLRTILRPTIDAGIPLVWNVKQSYIDLSACELFPLPWRVVPSPSMEWRWRVAVYAIRQICERGAATLGRKVNCLTDDEALRLAQRMADAGLSLQIWRGNDLIGTVMATQHAIAE